MNYWNRGRSHIRTFVPVGVPRLHAVFDRVPACRNGFRKGAGGCCRCLCIAPVVYRPFQNIGDRVAVRIGYAVLIGEIGALDPKIGITAGNHGRLVMNYGNISACGVCGIIAVAVLCADAVF